MVWVVAPGCEGLIYKVEKVKLQNQMSPEKSLSLVRSLPVFLAVKQVSG